MTGRPAIWGPEHAAAFDDADVARRYRFRPKYAAAALELVVSLIDPATPAVLDLGTGTGDVARALAPRVDRVDAVDISARMIAEGKRLDGGDRGNIRWIVGAAETVTLHGRYGLVTAGASLHWMDWDVVMPRISDVLSERGVLAVIDVGDQLQRAPGPVLDAIVRHSVYQGSYEHVDLIATLTERGHFAKVGERTFRESFSQPVGDVIDGLLATSSLAAWRIGAERVRSFADEVTRVAPRDAHGQVTRELLTTVVWGKPS